MKKDKNKELMEYKLVHDFKKYYNLKFRVKEGTLLQRIFCWRMHWHTFNKYTPPHFAGDYFNDGFNWDTYWVEVNSKEDGEKYIKKLYARCPTYGDFEREHIQPQYDAFDNAKRRYNEYWDKVNSVGHTIK